MKAGNGMYQFLITSSTRRTIPLRSLPSPCDERRVMLLVRPRPRLARDNHGAQGDLEHNFAVTQPDRELLIPLAHSLPVPHPP